MSSIPTIPNVVVIPPSPIASALQSEGAQRDSSRAIDSAANEEAGKAKTFSAGPDAILEIESTDADTLVHTDSGGQGGQGRYDAKPEEDATDEQPAEKAPGITVDEQGRPHLDLSI